MWYVLVQRQFAGCEDSNHAADLSAGLESENAGLLRWQKVTQTWAELDSFLFTLQTEIYCTAKVPNTALDYNSSLEWVFRRSLLRDQLLEQAGLGNLKDCHDGNRVDNKATRS
jgi:hypothetical protein